MTRPSKPFSTWEGTQQPPSLRRRLCDRADAFPAGVSFGRSARRAAGRDWTAALDKEVIRAVIRARVDEVRQCYDAIALTQPGSSGRMVIRFGIGPSGAVQTSCLVSSNLGAPFVDGCVVERALTWRFPAPEGGGWVIVTYPFTFERPAH